MSAATMVHGRASRLGSVRMAGFWIRERLGRGAGCARRVFRCAARHRGGGRRGGGRRRSRGSGGGGQAGAGRVGDGRLARRRRGGAVPGAAVRTTTRKGALRQAKTPATRTPAGRAKPEKPCPSVSAVVATRAASRITAAASS